MASNPKLKAHWAAVRKYMESHPGVSFREAQIAIKDSGSKQEHGSVIDILEAGRKYLEFCGGDLPLAIQVLKFLRPGG